MRKLLFILLLIWNSTRMSGQIISTVAGSGNYGYTGDGGPAISAQLGDMYYCYPAFDNAGNMYIAQQFNNTIRKVDASGIITTIAGTNGVIGYTGDGGPAANALLYHPTSIAVDNNNNIYIVDGVGSYIRKIDAAGIITTVSGQQTNGCGVGDGGPLSSARFWAISAITFDANNNLYIADYGCNTIRKVSNTNIVSTIAGNGTLGFSGDGGLATSAQMAYPCKIAVDNAGNVYIPDAQNHRIRKVSTTGIISTIAGTGAQGYSGDGGQAINAEIAFPGSVVIDNAGNLYFGDFNNVVRKIDPSGIISTYAGTGAFGYTGDGGPAIQATLSLTEGRISIYNDNLYMVNYPVGYAIRKIVNCLTATISQQPVPVTLCTSGNASFSVTASGATSYQWQFSSGSGWVDLVDNATYSGSATPTLLITGAGISMNGYQYRCVLVNGCAPVSSTAATLTVQSPVTPAVNIIASSNNICQGTAITFTANLMNGGTTPMYQWKKNGVNVGANQNTYTDNSLVNGDQVSCVLNSNAACITGSTATSNTITVTVNSTVVPAVTIAASALSVCSGTTVQFTASPVNGGGTPQYNWYKNNTSLSVNAPVYSDNTLNNGDIIQCSMSSSLSCITTATVTSNMISMIVTPNATASVTITASSNPVCRNSPVTFTATPVNGGNNPGFNWTVNGSPAGSSNAVFTSSLANGDAVSCVLHSNAACVSNTSVTSNIIRVNLYPDPVVSLGTTPGICAGSSRVLDAGNFSSYLWNNGAVSRTITVNGTGHFSVLVTDNHGCTGSGSTDITSVLPAPSKFLGSDTAICSYGSVDLKPAGVFGSYLWYNGSILPIVTVTQPGQYWLEVTGANGCTGKDTINVIRKDCLQGFFMPTAFTPNRDGKNDLVRPIVLGRILQYEFRVYNRYGQLVFRTTDINAGWDGYFEQQEQNGHAFVWICNYQFEGEAVQNKRGSFVLVK